MTEQPAHYSDLAFGASVAFAIVAFVYVALWLFG
jgi:hypothetical protein